MLLHKDFFKFLWQYYQVRYYQYNPLSLWEEKTYFLDINKHSKRLSPWPYLSICQGLDQNTDKCYVDIRTFSTIVSILTYIGFIAGQLHSKEFDSCCSHDILHQIVSFNEVENKIVSRLHRYFWLVCFSLCVFKTIYGIDRAMQHIACFHLNLLGIQNNT